MTKVRHHPLWAMLAALVVPALAFGAGVVGVVVYTTPEPMYATSRTIQLDPNTISAKAAVIYDPATHEVLYQKNANSQLPLASLTKLMTAQVVLASRDPNTPVRITAADLKPEGDWGLTPGETLTLRELWFLGWEKLHGKESRAQNPWLFVVGFRRIG